MMNALQTLIDNGCSEATIETVLNDFVGNDEFEGDDKRCCVAMLFDYEQGDHDDPSGYAAYDDVVDAPGAEYRVLDDDEADAACKEYIEESVWSFNPSFLAGETGIDEDVFEALSGKCEDANKAVRSLIDGSCGIDSFVESVVGADGRGHYLSGYDGEEHEVSDYYVYRIN
jgi:hypothetical protein